MIKRRGGSSAGELRILAHRPGWRLVRLVAVAVACLTGIAGGYLLGQSKAGIDQRYLDSLEAMSRSNEAQIAELNQQLIDSDLGREVDRDAAQELRASIKSLRDEIAGLQEEVRFYKSLMSPSSLERGLQIAEFEVTPTGVERQYSYHILLTQVESRRDWIQGELQLSVTDEKREQVLSLTELAELDAYPLKFRFRYFQALSGVLTLPDGFSPHAVMLTALRRGTPNQKQERRFDWVVHNQGVAAG